MIPKSGEQEDQTAPILDVRQHRDYRLRTIWQETGDTIVFTYACFAQTRGCIGYLLTQLIETYLTSCTIFSAEHNCGPIACVAQQVRCEIQFSTGKPLRSCHISGLLKHAVRFLAETDVAKAAQRLPETAIIRN